MALPRLTWAPPTAHKPQSSSALQRSPAQPRLAHRYSCPSPALWLGAGRALPAPARALPAPALPLLDRLRDMLQPGFVPLEGPRSCSLLPLAGTASGCQHPVLLLHPTLLNGVVLSASCVCTGITLGPWLASLRQQLGYALTISGCCSCCPQDKEEDAQGWQWSSCSQCGCPAAAQSSKVPVPPRRGAAPTSAHPVKC